MTTQTSKAPAGASPQPAQTTVHTLPEVPTWRRKLRPYLLSIPAVVIVIPDASASVRVRSFWPNVLA